MYAWLETQVRPVLRRYLGNEEGQDALTWLLILLVLFLIFSGRRVLVQ